jgi:hypothetical protein
LKTQPEERCYFMGDVMRRLHRLYGMGPDGRDRASFAMLRIEDATGRTVLFHGGFDAPVASPLRI